MSTIKYTLEFMPQAERDLEDIFDYISEELKNPKAAADLIDAISKRLIGLEDMPLSCPFSQISELARDGYRKCVIRNFIVLYKIDEIKKSVILAKIFYGKRNYKNLGLY